MTAIFRSRTIAIPRFAKHSYEATGWIAYNIMLAVLEELGLPCALGKCCPPAQLQYHGSSPHPGSALTHHRMSEEPPAQRPHARRHHCAFAYCGAVTEHAHSISSQHPGIREALGWGSAPGCGSCSRAPFGSSASSLPWCSVFLVRAAPFCDDDDDIDNDVGASGKRGVMSTPSHQPPCSCNSPERGASLNRRVGLSSVDVPSLLL